MLEMEKMASSWSWLIDVRDGEDDKLLILDNRCCRRKKSKDLNNNDNKNVHYSQPWLYTEYLHVTKTSNGMD